MPRYFFDIIDGTRHWVDPIGNDYPDEAAARNEAMNTLAEQLRGRSFTDAPTTIRCVIRDVAGKPLWSVVLCLALEAVN